MDRGRIRSCLAVQAKPTGHARPSVFSGTGSHCGNRYVHHPGRRYCSLCFLASHWKPCQAPLLNETQTDIFIFRRPSRETRRARGCQNLANFEFLVFSPARAIPHFVWASLSCYLMSLSGSRQSERARHRPRHCEAEGDNFPPYRSLEIWEGAATN